MIGHHSDALFEEMAYLAWQAHWPHDQLMNLTHGERRRWVREFERMAAHERQGSENRTVAWP